MFSDDDKASITDTQFTQTMLKVFMSEFDTKMRLTFDMYSILLYLSIL